MRASKSYAGKQVTYSHAFCSAWHGQYEFALCSDWLIGLSASSVIGQSYYFGFMTLN